MAFLKTRRALCTFGRVIKRNLPEICTILGSTGTIAATVTACVATYKKLPEIIDQADVDISDIESDETLNEDDVKHAIKVVRAKEATGIAKTYAVPAVIEAVSLTLIICGHRALRKENLGLSAALGTVSTAYCNLRERIKERYGEEAERDLRYGIKHETVEEEYIDENGKKKKVKKDVAYMDSLPGDYSRFFDDSSRKFDPSDNQFNISFLNQRQNWFNDQLKIRGYVTLNEVYRDLDIPTIPDGIVMGWMYSRDPEKQVGKPYIDFDIWNINKAKNRDFVNGYEDAILLNFDVIDLTKAYPAIFGRRK